MVPGTGRRHSRSMLQPAGIARVRIVVVALLACCSLMLTSAAPARQAAFTCTAAGGTAPVQAPRFVRNTPTGETGWFSSPSLVDLNGDGKLEIVAPFYSTFVFDARGRLLAKGTATKGRVYAPGVVADLDGDKIPEIVVGGNEGTVAAYDFVGGRLKLKPGWPTSTATVVSRWSRRRPTRRPRARRCSCSTRQATSTTRKARRRHRGRDTT